MTRSSLIGACVGLAVVAGAALAASAAPAQQDAQPGRPLKSVRAPNCSLPGAMTINANRHVRVFRKTRRGHGAAYGCLRRADRAFRLGIVGECQNNDEVRKAEVAGRRAALGIFSCALYSGSWRLDVVNLRDGRREFTSRPISLPPADDATYDTLERIVVTPDGAVAWTAVRSGAAGVRGGVEVRRRRRGTTNQAVLLDNGLEIDPESLRRRGRTITWTKAGARRSAQL